MGVVADLGIRAQPRGSLSMKIVWFFCFPYSKVFATPIVGMSRRNPACEANPVVYGCKIPFPSRRRMDGFVVNTLNTRSTKGNSRYEKYVEIKGKRVGAKIVFSSTRSPVA